MEKFQILHNNLKKYIVLRYSARKRLSTASTVVKPSMKVTRIYPSITTKPIVNNTDNPLSSYCIKQPLLTPH